MDRKQFEIECTNRRKRGFFVAPAHTPSYGAIPRGTAWGVRGSLWAAGHHTGEDWLAPVGSLANTTCWGHVIATGEGGGSLDWGSEYGLMVIIRTRSGLYDVGFAHLSKITAKVGDRFVPGHVVGLTGNTGHTTGAHLHYEVRPAGGNYGSDVSPLHVEHNG